MGNDQYLSVQTELNIPRDIVWELYTIPDHIQNWNFASDDWHCPSAHNDLTNEGRFSWRMESKDGTMGFDYSGQYTSVIPPEKLEAVLDDNRNVIIDFIDNGTSTILQIRFQPESENSEEMQELGWQAILNNFKNYAENKVD